MNNKSQKKGFTIIEVVLVLAIAGLIFLMVFIALPALQRSQRDTQRREDMARFLSQLNQYQANNGGKVPGEGSAAAVGPWNTFINNYLKVGGDTFQNPNGVSYTVKKAITCSSTSCNVAHSSSSEALDYTVGAIFVYLNATCNGESATYAGAGSARKVAITYKLEGAGVYCGHN